jgi:hypothetical protein
MAVPLHHVDDAQEGELALCALLAGTQHAEQFVEEEGHEQHACLATGAIHSIQNFLNSRPITATAIRPMR